MSIDGVDRLAQRNGEQNGDSRPSASVLRNGLRVLESFSITEPVLGVTAIARRVDLHNSSVSPILATLWWRAANARGDELARKFPLYPELTAMPVSTAPSAPRFLAAMLRKDPSR